MRRVNVFGSSGSGKTTVAQALARRLGVQFVEIDHLYWSVYPNWREPTNDELRVRVEEATRGDSWVVDGSYTRVRDIVWSRADTVVWLDPPFLQRLWRVLARTLRRSLTGETLWGTQKESLRASLLSRDSLILFMLRTERHRARVYGEWLARPEYEHLELIRLRSQSDIDRWLANT